jgi:hypothetical protein
MKPLMKEQHVLEKKTASNIRKKKKKKKKTHAL